MKSKNKLYNKWKELLEKKEIKELSSETISELIEINSLIILINESHKIMKEKVRRWILVTEKKDKPDLDVLKNILDEEF